MAERERDALDDLLDEERALIDRNITKTDPQTESADEKPEDKGVWATDIPEIVPQEEVDYAKETARQIGAQKRYYRQRKLDEDFLGDMTKAEITTDNDKLMARCNQFVTDRISEVHNNGNILNDMKPFTDARSYADTLVAFVRNGWEEIASDEFKAVRTALINKDRDALIKLGKIDLQKVVETDAGQINAMGGAINVGRKEIVDKDKNEVDQSISEYVNGVMARNFVHLYESVKPELSNASCEIVDDAIRQGKFDPKHIPELTRILQERPDEGELVCMLVQSARPTTESLFTDTGYEFAKMCKDMLSKAAYGFSEFLRRGHEGQRAFLDWLHEDDRVKAKVAEGMSIGEAQAAVDIEDARHRAWELANEKDRLEMRRAELRIDELMSHKSWDGYGFWGNAFKGAVVTLPYMAVNAVPYLGFATNVFYHMQDVEDQINLGGGDPTDGRFLRSVGAIGWAAVEKLEFDGLFGRSLTRIEKRVLWTKLMRDGIRKLAPNSLQIGKAVVKELGAKTAYETFQEGVQGGIEGIEYDLGFFNDADPKKRKDMVSAIGDACSRFFGDMKDSFGTMMLLSLAGAGGGVAMNMRRQYRYALDGESLNEMIARMNKTNSIIDGTWKESGDEETKLNHRREVLSKLIDVWTSDKSTPEKLAELEEKFNLTPEQANTIADALDIRGEFVEMLSKTVGDNESVREYLAKLGGIDGTFKIGGDNIYDIVSLFKIINPNIKIENLEVEDDSLPTVITPDGTVLVDLRERKTAAEERVRNAKVGSERRGAQRELRKINKKIAKEEAKKPEPKRPTKTVRRVIVPMTDAKGNTVEKRIVVSENDKAPDITTESFADSVAEAVAGSGLEIDGNKVENNAESMKQAAKWFYNLANSNRDDAFKFLVSNGLSTGGSFRVVDESTGKDLVDADGIITMERAISEIVHRGGNLTLSHEHAHAIVSFAKQLGVFGDASAPDYDPSKNEVVVAMRKLFGNPVNSNELFNEERFANMFSSYLRDEFDFKRPDVVDDRDMIERVFDAIGDSIKALFNHFSGKELRTSRDNRIIREGQVAAFEALRNGDLRGLSRYAGIKFTAEGEARAVKTEEGTVEPNSEDKPKVVKSPKRKEWKSRKSMINGDVPENGGEEAEQVAEAVGDVANPNEVIASLQKQLAELKRNPNPVRASNAPHIIKSPSSSRSIKAVWMWIPRKSIVAAKAGAANQQRDRENNDESFDLCFARTRKGNFDPLYMTGNYTGDSGAAIVAGGNECISGNGRQIMLGILADEGRYGEYLEPVRAWCRDNGIIDCPPELLNQEPELVQRVVEGTSKEDLDQFARECNENNKQELNDIEKAKGDAEKITPKLMRLYNVPADGNFLAKSNHPFILAFLDALHVTGAKFNDGTPTPAAADRVKNAFLGLLLGVADSASADAHKRVFLMLQTLMQNSDGLRVGELRNALLRNGGELYAMLGNKGSYNIIPELRAAVNEYISWRAAQVKSPNLSFADYLNTNDMFKEAVTPLQEAVARLLDTSYLNAVLRRYHDLVAQEDVDAQGLLGIEGAERHTAGQLLAIAERDVVEKDGDGNPVSPYVTRDPDYDGYHLQEQTPPAVQAVVEVKREAPVKSVSEGTKTPEPKVEKVADEKTEKALKEVEKVFAPKVETPFVPVKAVKGTAEVPLSSGKGRGELVLGVDDEGKRKTINLGAGVWDYLRIPYKLSAGRIPSSPQDKAGRGLWGHQPIQGSEYTMIDRLNKWSGRCPRYMGNKNKMTERTVRSIWTLMSPSERAHYKTVVDCFGGGGCWGLTLAMTSFDNANRLIVNEFDGGRLEKIRLMHTHGAALGEECRQLLNGGVFANIVSNLSRSATNVITFRAQFLSALNDRKEVLSADDIGMGYAIYDNMMYVMQYGEQDETGGFSPDKQLEKAIRQIGEDAKKATEMAEAYKARGGGIVYVAGDAKNQDSFGVDGFVVPHGDDVMEICDPPYYRTTGYNDDGSTAKVRYGREAMGWGYQDTEDMLKTIVDTGSGIIYTDEAWFYNKDFREKTNVEDFGQASLFGDTSSLWGKGQGTLCNIINNLDHFDCAGDVDKRYELLGVHHGHTIEHGSVEHSGNSGDDNVVESQGSAGAGGADGSGVLGLGAQAVSRMDAGSSTEDGVVRGNDTEGGRGSASEKVVAVETAVQVIEKAVEDAGETVTPEVDAEVRRSVRQVREDRIADFARFASNNAAKWLKKRRAELDKRMSEAGYTEKVWHGTGAGQFTVFRLATREESEGALSGFADDGIKMAFFSYYERTAQNYAALSSFDIDTDYETLMEGAKPDVREYYVNPGKCLELDEAKWPQSYQQWTQTLKKAWEDGYDSVKLVNAFDDQGVKLIEEPDGTERMEWPNEDELGPKGTPMEDNSASFQTDILVVFDHGEKNPGANRIKAADPVTFWDEEHGELPIPLEMRANRDFPDLRFSVTMGKKAKEEARKAIEKYRPELGKVNIESADQWRKWRSEYEAIAGKKAQDEEYSDTPEFEEFLFDKRTEMTVAEIEKFPTPKARKAALYWFCRDSIRLPEDAPKVEEALKIAEKAKVDPFQYDRPAEILEKFAKYRPAEKPIDPDTVLELSDKREMGHGIVTYLVQDNKAGQLAMRKIINTHFGKGASPWCLLQADKDGNLTRNAWEYWEKYNALPKRVAFKDGKLVAFMATDESVLGGYEEAELRYEEAIEDGAEIPDKEAWIREQLGQSEKWWDRTDKSHNGIPFTEKDAEGRTLYQEMRADGEVSITKITRGVPNVDGVYEEWNEESSSLLTDTFYHKIVERANGMLVSNKVFTRNGVQVVDQLYKEIGGSTISIKKAFYENTGDLYNVILARGNNTSVLQVDSDSFKIDLHDVDSYHETANFLSNGTISIRREEEDYYGRVTTKVYDFADGKLRHKYVNGRPSLVNESNPYRLPKIEVQDVVDLMDAAYADGEALIAPISSFISNDSSIRYSVAISPSDAATDPAAKAYLDAVNRPDANERTTLLAPNGKRSNLTNALYHLVRTKRFKDWFGDWERLARIVKLRNSNSIEFTWGNQYELNRNAARSWALDNLRNDYTNDDTGDKIYVVRDGIRKVTSHGTHEDAHLKSIAAIPQMIKNAIFIDERPNEKNKNDYDYFRYYVAGINIDGVPYTVKVVVGVKGKRKFYDHRLTQIEKGALIDGLSDLPSTTNENPLNDVYDTKLIDLLQVGNVSKVVDENGEPMVVWHGTDADFTVFDRAKGRSTMDIQGMFFSPWELDASGYGGKVGAYFLSIQNPAYEGVGYRALKNFQGQNEAGKKAREYLESLGYDGVINGTEEYIAFRPEQIKSADPVTYDDAGNVIPLSDRFSESNDIRYSVVSKQAITASSDERELSPENAELRRSIIVGAHGTHKWKSVNRRLITALKMASGVRYNDKKRKEIYRETGWWIGVDGKWRFEISNVKPKSRAGATRGKQMVNGLRTTNGVVYLCKLDEIVRHPNIFELYPELKSTIVRIVDPDSLDGYSAMLQPALNEITITWDDVKWRNDEPSNVLNENGLVNISHEIQHAVQEFEDFSRGGSVEDNGKLNYHRLAGEVEARNAASRNWGVYNPILYRNASAREMGIELEAAPWQTEDVPPINQILLFNDGNMTDRNGRPVERRSIRRKPTARTPMDVAVGYAASLILGGQKIDPKDLETTMRNIGIANASVADVLSNAQYLAQRKRERASDRVVATDPELFVDLADENMRLRVSRQIDEAIVKGARVADPKLGKKIAEMAQAHQNRALAEAKGFTAREMMVELPISLADAVFAEAEYERSPEELKRMEQAKAKREEAREAERKAAEEAGVSVEEYREMQIVNADSVEGYEEPSAEAKAYFAELWDRAKFKKEQRDKEKARAAHKKARRAAVEGGNADSSDDAGGGEGRSVEPVLPVDTIRRIAPVFESADMFAEFICEWCADKVVERHPEIPSTAQMWRNPVAVKELIRTAQSVLKDLSMDVLGSPQINSARNYADRAIFNIAERKTYKGVMKQIAYAYDMIHNSALRLSRRKLVNNLVKAVTKATGAIGRFSSTKDMSQRKIDGATELWARHLLPYLTMGEERLNKEIAELEAIIDGYNRESKEDGYVAENFQEYRDACDKLALANRYGGMIRWMPSKILAASAEIMEELGGRRQAFEAMREERDGENNAIRSAIINAVLAGESKEYRRKAGKIVGKLSRFGNEYRGQLKLEMQSLIRYCKDDAARERALQAIDELDIIISQGTEKYKVTFGTALDELNEGLAGIYGSAEAGMRHLLDERIPEDVALQIFSQSRDRIPTYGQLLQLYASCLQKDYQDNIRSFGRDDQLELMRNTLTEQDLAFHAWAIDWYAHNRESLSDAVEEITGLKVASPDNLYVPVKVENEPEGFSNEVKAWSPVPSALSRRVHHSRDFDESANFLSMIMNEIEVRSQVIGYGVAGIRMRDTIAERNLQAAVRQFVGREDMRIVSNHVRDVLMQGANRKDSYQAFSLLNAARRWVARFYLSGNLPSAIKQLVSMPMWACVAGGGNAMRYFASAFTADGWNRIQELIETDGYKARYMMGWSEEIVNMMRNPSRKKWLRTIEKAYDFGMGLNRGMDKIACLWMAQGYYGDMKQAMMDKGFDEDEAKARAAALTWSAVEQTQQSGRLENMNVIQREQGAMNAIFQFMSSQLLQNGYEIQAIKDVAAGTQGAKGRLLRILVINHLLIPALLETVAILWRAVMGEEPLPDDPDKWSKWLKDFGYECLLGQAAPVFMLAQGARSIYDKVTGNKSWYKSSSIPALDGMLKVFDRVGTLAVDLGKYGIQEWTPFEVEDELTLDKLQEDLLKAVDSTVAPAKHIHRAISNRAE